jgi:hypothetical protein
MTQSYYEPIQYDLDGKRVYCIGENYYLFPDMSSIKSYSNIPHNRKVIITTLNKRFCTILRDLTKSLT